MKRFFSLFVLAAAVCGLSHAEIHLPTIFGDNMLLQQQTDVNMWGKASAGSTVSVTPSWSDKSFTTKADKQGDWSISFATPQAGEGFEITLSDGGKPTTIKNVAIGELWLCSGQSNMYMPMKGFKSQPVEGSNMDILHSTNPKIRLFKGALQSSVTPLDTIAGRWQEANPESVRAFSATA